MNNTALRAGAQSANKTHMVFADEKHEKFYYEKLEQAGYQDCHHKALIYILGISEDTRNHFSQIYDIQSGYIKTDCLRQGWQTGGSVCVVRLAFNLYTDGTSSIDDYESRDGQLNRCRAFQRKVFEYISKQSFLLRLCKPNAVGFVFLAGHKAPLSGILPKTGIH